MSEVVFRHMDLISLLLVTVLCFLLYFVIYFFEYNFLATSTGFLLTDCKFFMSSGRTNLRVNWKSRKWDQSAVEVNTAVSRVPDRALRPGADHGGGICVCSSAPGVQTQRESSTCPLLSWRSWCHRCGLTHPKLLHVLQYATGTCSQGICSLADPSHLTLFCNCLHFYWIEKSVLLWK